jgi:hypothetical protein
MADVGRPEEPRAAEQAKGRHVRILRLAEARQLQDLRIL